VNKYLHTVASVGFFIHIEFYVFPRFLDVRRVEKYLKTGGNIVLLKRNVTLQVHE